VKPFNKEKCESKELNVGDWAMHGDVVIERVESVPKDFSKLSKTTKNELAFGEATGHLHQLGGGEFDLRIDKENPSVRHLRVVTPVALRHQEHKEIVLPPGDYRTRIQREYDPFSKRIRDVAD